MIRPTKHSHPDKTLVYASFLILKKVRKERLVAYSDLLKYIKANIKSGEFLFLPALNLLYLLGVINYLPKTDMIEYRES
ncbi:conserved hypothetical protein [Enhydrobacter sp. AX1]|jgi:hypothetical protein|nr:ABC-three component system middle component 8 [Enhydrobacter sp. AX1]VXA91390.1 conserved hypothetical protein [Enhydrobacter sp. AX1]